MFVCSYGRMVPMFVRFVRSCVRALVHSCVRSCVLLSVRVFARSVILSIPVTSSNYILRYAPHVYDLV